MATREELEAQIEALLDLDHRSRTQQRDLRNLQAELAALSPRPRSETIQDQLARKYNVPPEVQAAMNDQESTTEQQNLIAQWQQTPEGRAHLAELDQFNHSNDSRWGGFVGGMVDSILPTRDETISGAEVAGTLAAGYYGLSALAGAGGAGAGGSAVTGSTGAMTAPAYEAATAAGFGTTGTAASAGLGTGAASTVAGGVTAGGATAAATPAAAAPAATTTTAAGTPWWAPAAGTLAASALLSNDSTPPAPDPSIAESAKTNSQIALSNEARAQQQWDRYLQIYAPVEEASVNEAMNIDSAANMDAAAGVAASDVRRSFDNAQGTRARELASMGINPNSGRSLALNNEATIMKAAAEAGAKTGARRTVNDRGIAMRAGVSNLGRGMPNTVASMSSGAVNANNSSASILGNQYSTGVNAWNANNANRNTAMQGYGQLIGQGLSAYYNQ